MKDEIVSGLKNAVERGSTIEQAVQSFINAGYNPVEVRQAASFMSSGATSISTQPFQQIPQPTPHGGAQGTQPQNFSNYQQIPQQEIQPYSNYQQIPQRKSGSKFWIILLIILLILLIGGIISAIFFGQEILDFIFK